MKLNQITVRLEADPCAFSAEVRREVKALEWLGASRLRRNNAAAAEASLISPDAPALARRLASRSPVKLREEGLKTRAASTEMQPAD